MWGSGPAATAHHVQPAAFGPIFKLRRECFRSFGKPGRQEWIGQARIGIAAHGDRRDAAQFLDEWAHFTRSERTIHSDAQEWHVREGIPEGLDGLARHPTIAPRLDESH